jgi:hypothetical protein
MPDKQPLRAREEWRVSEMISDVGDGVKTLRALLLTQLRLVDAAIHAAAVNASTSSAEKERVLLPKSMRAVLPLMMQSAGSSCHTILMLSQAPELPVRDCFPIARAIVEMIINVCYILAEGEDVAARMETHAFQKSFRDLNRTSNVAGMTINLGYRDAPDASSIPGMPEALAEFSTRKGDERRTWTEESLESRLSTIADKFGTKIGTPLHVAQFAIYRHSSEILHGTFFGCLYFFGATQPGFQRTGSHASEVLLNHLLLILFNLVMTIDAMLQALNHVITIKEVAAASQAICDRIQEIPLFKNALHAG